MIQDCLGAFPKNYGVRILPELPGGAMNANYFPASPSGGGKDGLLLEITPTSGPPWVGIFAFGGGIWTISAMSSTPDPNCLCVIAQGALYFVDVSNPKKKIDVRNPYPITFIQPVVNQNMIIVADYTTVAALAGHCVIWRTDRISWDGIKISTLTEDSIEGEASDPTARVQPRFSIDLRTGSVISGAFA